jgi:hypothetical protein
MYFSSSRSTWDLIWRSPLTRTKMLSSAHLIWILNLETPFNLNLGLCVQLSKPEIPIWRFVLTRINSSVNLWHLVFSTVCSMMATFSEGLLLSEKVGLDPNVLVEVFVNRENLVRLCRVTCHQTPWRLTEFILLFVFYWIILVLSISFEHAQWYNHCSAVLWKINEETRWFSVCFISSSAFVCVRESERERERERFWMMLN